MDEAELRSQRRKHQIAGLKAAETKGEAELIRAGQMAAFTKKYGKDVENPYRRPQTEAERLKEEQKAELEAELAKLAEQFRRSK